MFLLPERFKRPFVIAAPNPIFLASLVIILIILIGIFLPLSSVNKKLPTPPVNFAEINYPSRVWQERVLANAEAAALEKDANKRFELYSQIFTDLAAIYERDHQAKTRGELESLVDFLANELPNPYKAENFNIPCLDSACGTPTYPAEIEQIKIKLGGIEAIEPLVLDNVLKKFETAALSTDPNFQWQNYFTAFREIVSEKERTNDGEINQIALRLRDFIKQSYPENYNQIEKAIPESINI